MLLAIGSVYYLFINQWEKVRRNYFFTCVVCSSSLCNKHFLLDFPELWRGDVTDRMNIGIGVSGFHQIRLDCSNNRFDILVDTEDEFHGVVYTRGYYTNFETLQLSL